MEHTQLLYNLHMNKEKEKIRSIHSHNYSNEISYIITDEIQTVNNPNEQETNKLIPKKTFWQKLKNKLMG